VIRIDAQHNLLSVLLLGGIGLFGLLGGLNFLLLGHGSADSIEPASAGLPTTGEARAPTQDIGELERFAVIMERPVFFEDRQLPVIDDAELANEEPVEDVPVVEEVPELEASVAGIIITPDLRLAMIADKQGRETQVLEEGMALEGELSAWKLTEIRPRSVRFATDAGRSADLELQVETNALAAGAPPSRPPQRDQPIPQTAPSANSPTSDTEAQAAARARAEEIRRRVAERRAQLREEAERRAREQQDNDGR
jgi:general secretion pathway protein N